MYVLPYRSLKVAVQGPVLWPTPYIHTYICVAEGLVHILSMRLPKIVYVDSNTRFSPNLVPRGRMANVQLEQVRSVRRLTSQNTCS
jgi:hypothetical protein